ncbi:PqqD family protein [Geodermatophilus sp. SYSU D01036]
MRLRSGDLSTRELGDEMVLLDLRSSRYLTVSGVGVDIVSMLGEERTEDQLVSSLLERYEVTEDVLRADVNAFLRDLRDAGLLE